MKIIDYNCLSHTKTCHLEYEVLSVFSDVTLDRGNTDLYL